MSKYRKHYSYGVIAFNNDKSKFLLVQPRYSYAYMTLIMHKFNSNDLSYIEYLVSATTELEKHKLLNYSHRDLWIKMWYFAKNKNLDNRDFSSANKFFDKFHRGYYTDRGIFVELDSLVKRSTSIKSIKWGFPKGKRKIGEKGMIAAKREFLEETGINPKSVEFYNEEEIPPVCEEFFGGDGNDYVHYYYFAKINETCGFLNPYNGQQSCEIDKVGWFDVKNLTKKIGIEGTSVRLDTIKALSQSQSQSQGSK